MHLNFTVLFPASDVWGHIREVNLFLEEGVHLSLDWIWLARNDKSTSIIDARHLVKILMLTSVGAHDIELGVENILTVASVGNTIVNNKLDHDFLCVITMEREIFTVAGYNVAVLSESLLDSGLSIAGIVLNKTFGANVTRMILTSFCNFIAPSEWLNFTLFSKELDGLIDCINTLFGSKSNFAWSFKEEPIKLLNHVF